MAAEQFTKTEPGIDEGRTSGHLHHGWLLLHKQHYTLKANEKRLSGTTHPDRDQQIEYLEDLKAAYLAAGHA